MKARTEFPLFSSHLDLAHMYWASIIRPEDSVIDATCGNGHDTLALARMGPKGLYALDIQAEALKNAKKLTNQLLTALEWDKITWVLCSHEAFPCEIEENTIKCIVYNLGYLPGGDKSLTTQAETTLNSLKNALKLVQSGGCISLTCYPGHPEGAEEEQCLLEYASTLDPKIWSCCHHRWTNRNKAPSLMIIQKRSD